jgi:hypothetical protein
MIVEIEVDHPVCSGLGLAIPLSATLAMTFGLSDSFLARVVRAYLYRIMARERMLGNELGIRGHNHTMNPIPRRPLRPRP